jgi:hypothetical protein
MPFSVLVTVPAGQLANTFWEIAANKAATARMNFDILFPYKWVGHS